MRLMALAAATCAWITGAAAQLPTELGQEAPVGRNLTGEDCRLRLVSKINQGQIQDWHRYAVMCGEWKQAVGDFWYIRSSRSWPPERRLGEEMSWFRDRFTDCKPVEDIKLANRSGKARECQRESGGYAVLTAAVADVKGRDIGFDSLPTNMPVLERAVAIMAGDATTATTTTSPAVARAQVILGPTGQLVKAGDIGALKELLDLGDWYVFYGDYRNAELTYRRRTELVEKVSGAKSPQAARSLALVGVALANQRRFPAAETAIKQAVALAGGRKDIYTGDIHRNLSWFESQRGNHQAALAAGQRAEAIHREVASARQAQAGGRGGAAQGGPVRGYGIAVAIIDQGIALRELQRYDEAIAKLKDGVAMLETVRSPMSYWALLGRRELAQAYHGAKQTDLAIAEIRRVIDARQTVFGESHAAASAYLILAQFQFQTGQNAQAVAAAREMIAITRNNRVTRDQIGRPYLFFAMAATVKAAAQDAANAQSYLADALWAAQLYQATSAASGLRTMASRMATDDPALRDVVRAMQDAERAVHEQSDELVRLLALDPSQREADAEARAKAELQRLEAEAAAAERTLIGKFPRYAGLASNKPVPAEDLLKALKPGEALLDIAPVGSGGAFVFLLRDGKIHAHQTRANEAELKKQVLALREGLEPQSGKKFDPALAYALYRDLLGPIAAQMKGVKHLFVAATGSLSSLPFDLLVTQAPAPGQPLAQMAWLLKDHAVSVLPAIGALRDLRQTARASQAKKPFIGFGDPSFAGDKSALRGLGTLGAACRGDGQIARDQIANLPRLAETADELNRIAKSMGADAADVVLGNIASEAEVKKRNLRDYRVVAFATHGLLPEELLCQSEPALVLTPPTRATNAEDGLLDASEIARLRLDADLVLLSACNTAGPGAGTGGESLSGLARAFFYAGARSVLASHWAVESNSAVTLTTGLLKGMEAKQGKAEALRQAKLALLNDQQTAEPIFWAPFSLIGDGG